MSLCLDQVLGRAVASALPAPGEGIPATTAPALIAGPDLAASSLQPGKWKKPMAMEIAWMIADAANVWTSPGKSIPTVLHEFPLGADEFPRPCPHFTHPIATTVRAG